MFKKQNIMKNPSNGIMALSAASVLLFMASGCDSGSTGRRDPDEGYVPPSVKYIDNPLWSITYTGRDVDVSDDGTYVVDVIHVKSSDDNAYYLDIIDQETFSSDYGSDIDRYLDNIAVDDNWVYLHDSDNVFDMLDMGGGSWIAAAIEVLPNGRKGRNYSWLEFKTSDVEYRKDDSWNVFYTPRKTIREDGQEIVVDEITVEPNGCDYSYYVDIAYPEYIDRYYGGDVTGFFNDILDDIADGLPEDEDFGGVVYNGRTNVQFDRLRSGEWTAYVFGVDRRGYLTGNWSELDFVAPEEEATPEFRKWLGTWMIGGPGGGYDSDTGDPVTGYYYYNIHVSSAENNYYYLINDWETGRSASLMADAWCRDFQFETDFIPETGQMLFRTVDLGETYYPGDFSDRFYVNLLGGFEYGAEEYIVTDTGVPMATATLGGDGGKAVVRPEKVKTTVDGRTVTGEFLYMQYFGFYVYRDDFFTFNEAVPYFPMTMEKLDDAEDHYQRNAVERRLPAVRRAVAEEVPESKAGSGSARRHSRYSSVRTGSGKNARMLGRNVPAGEKNGSAVRRKDSGSPVQR